MAPPTLRIPSCAGECPSPLTSAHTRLTKPHETDVHYPMTQLRRCEANTRRSITTDHLTRSAASYNSTLAGSGGGHLSRGPRPDEITSQVRTPAAPGADGTAEAVTSKRKPRDLFASKWLRASNRRKPLCQGRQRAEPCL